MLMLLSEKSSGEVKGRGVYNGKNTRDWVSREDKASPTATNEGIFVTGVVDAKEGHDMMSNDIPNAFIQAKVPAKEEGKPHEKIIMKITGRLVNVLVSIAPEIYAKHVVY